MTLFATVPSETDKTDETDTIPHEAAFVTPKPPHRLPMVELAWLPCLVLGRSLWQPVRNTGLDLIDGALASLSPTPASLLKSKTSAHSIPFINACRAS